MFFFKLILMSDAHYSAKEMVIDQLRNETFEAKKNFLELALESNNPQVRQAVAYSLPKIPEEFRMVVYYAVVDGLPYADIAEIMDTPIGTVMSRLHRGKKMLRKMLAEYAAEEGYDVQPA